MPQPDHLDQAHKDLELLVKKILTGTADRPRRLRVIDIALERMDEWAATTPPPRTTGPRGGTSTTTEQTERAENHDVGRNAATDRQTALTLMRTISVATEQLYLLTRRYTAPVDTSKLPKPADTIPGCVSCARTKKKGPLTIGGHFVGISDRPAYTEKKLCRWCGDIERATGNLPSIEDCDDYHRLGPQAAARKRARQQRGKVTR